MAVARVPIPPLARRDEQSWPPEVPGQGLTLVPVRHGTVSQRPETRTVARLTAHGDVPSGAGRWRWREENTPHDQPPVKGHPAAQPALDRRAGAVLLLILLVAAAMRLVGINFPSRMVVDEFWYVRDGCYYWMGSVEACALAGLEAPDRDVETWLRTYGELTPEHPPLAKALIGLPVAVFGYRPTAWRLAAVVAGVMTVGLVFLLVLLLVRAVWAATLAAGLLAIDYIHVVHSRIAMLEVFVGLFAVAAMLFAALDRRQIERRAAGESWHPGWRAAAGIAAGAAAASKLSGVAVVVAVLALVVAWEVQRARRSGRPGNDAGRTALSVIALLVVLPAVVYAATYAGRLDGTPLAPPWAPGSWLGAFLDRQLAMLDFHATKPGVGTPPWTLPMSEPALQYALERSSDGALRTILLFGNPIVWWGGFIAVAVLGARALIGRSVPGAAIAVVGFAAAYAGWLSLTLTGRPVHLFYAVPLAPFLVVALAVTLAGSPGATRGLVAALGALSVAAFVFYLPILIGLPLSGADWEIRACSAQAIWLDPIEGCTRQPLP